MHVLADNSRVWIYQGDRRFSKEEAMEIHDLLDEFAESWTSHNEKLLAQGSLFHRQFIVFMVDESRAGASGCSIDKSVHFIKGIEAKYGINLFDRLAVTYIKDGDVHRVSREEFAKQFEQGIVTDETKVFNNLVKTKEEFIADWVIPLKDSWQKRMM